MILNVKFEDIFVFMMIMYKIMRMVTMMNFVKCDSTYFAVPFLRRVEEHWGCILINYSIVL